MKIINRRFSFWKSATAEQKLERYTKLFEERVIKKEGCWEWSSYIDSTGSGRIGFWPYILLAYRASWLIHRGEIPKGLLVLHKCHNRICSNPEHLYLGTNKDNIRDMLVAGRGNRSRQRSKMAKLDREKAREIKELLYDRIVSQRKIANRYGVSRGTVLDILRGKSWRNV